MKRLWVVLLILCSCVTATPQQTFDATKVAFVIAANGYKDELYKDNARIIECYSQHKTLPPAQQRIECPPKIPKESRERAQQVVHAANDAIVLIDMAFSLGRPLDQASVEAVEKAVAELPLLAVGQ